VSRARDRNANLPQDRFRDAVALHKRGMLSDAEKIYVEILRRHPGHFNALHLLGVVALQTQRAERGVELIGAAIKLNPGAAVVHGNLGNGLFALRRFEEAVASYDKAIALKPDYPEAHYNRGNALRDLRRYEQALASYDKAVALKPELAEAHSNRGNALVDLRRHEEALASYDKVIALRPDDAEAHANRGNALLDLRRLEQALASYDKALALKPDYAEAHSSRGIALRDLRRSQEAVASHDKAIALKPDYAEAHSNRGNALRDLRRFEEALDSYDKAIALQPDYPEAHSNRGNALVDLRRPEEALVSYDRAIALKPDYAEAHGNRGNALCELLRNEEAVASYDKALALKPDFAEARFAGCMAELPILYMNQAEIGARRSAYERRLRALCEADDWGTDPVHLAKAVGYRQPFYLPYQGYNDRDLQAMYGAFVCRVMARCYPPAAPVPPPGANEPVRIGIVSGFFRQHSNWKLPIKGWLSQLNRRQFQVFGYHTAGQEDAETKAAVAMCDRFVQGPLPIDRWREAILHDAPHVLIYPEVGMDPAAAALAAQRLAAVQCNSWGHPATSGFPTLDYYLSSDLMEPADGRDHYTERLIRLPNLSVYCEPLDAPSVSIAPQSFGLRSTATVYWCCQALYKYLPQFDEVLPRIARRVGDCQFVFIESPATHVTGLLRQRLDRVFGAHGLSASEHCVFLPRLDQHAFVAAAGCCHVFLDSIGWSGCNSTLESLPHDLPIVAMAGPLMRGRHSLAILRMMGVTETIAETIDDYVSIAVRLALDVPWRSAVKARIAAGKHRIYFDRACISKLEQFLSQVVRG
jgi:protein O-GlcNAc transferase